MRGPMGYVLVKWVLTLVVNCSRVKMVLLSAHESGSAAANVLDRRYGTIAFSPARSRLSALSALSHWAGGADFALLYSYFGDKEYCFGAHNAAAILSVQQTEHRQVVNCCPWRPLPAVHYNLATLLKCLRSYVT